MTYFPPDTQNGTIDPFPYSTVSFGGKEYEKMRRYGTLADPQTIDEVGAENIFVNNNQYVNNRLGIGTTNPLQPLHVQGNATVLGNLGVGIINPTQKLHIDGDVRITSGIYDSTNSNGDNSNVLRSNGTAIIWSPTDIPPGTSMLFYEGSAPTGWTKITTQNNKAIRVVSGTGAGSGGSLPFTTAFASRTPEGTISGSASAVTLTTTQIPSHNHEYLYKTATQQVNNGDGGLTNPFWTGDQNVSSEFTGGSGSHSHGLDATFTGTPLNFAVQYIDVIICTKD